jgi:hypothetical protein
MTGHKNKLILLWQKRILILIDVLRKKSQNQTKVETSYLYKPKVAI